MSAAGAQVLLVEDEKPYRELLERQLSKRGYQVTAVGSAEEALELELEAEVCLSDLSLPGLSGLELIERLLRRSPHLQCVVLTGHGSVPVAIEAMKLGAFHFFEKPVKLQELALCLEKAVDKHRLVNENRQLKAALTSAAKGREVLVGDSQPIEEIRRLIQQFGPAPSPVLILGETGTGKDLVARALHQASPRRDKPFLAVNCGTISESLENELFGHAEGAFTGAVREQRGFFEAADGGTLFIDEVAEMSLEVQKRFLRVLEDGQVRRLGEARSRQVNVRVVAATNKDLEDAVAQGEFRQDLYYRLEVLTIRTPPLRQHLADLPQIAEALLQRLALTHGRSKQAAPELLEALAKLNWPGNVRQLRNVLERGLVLAPGDVIRLEDCPEADLRAAGAETAAFARPGIADSSGDALPLTASGTLEDMEKQHIAQVLSECDGNKTEAAKQLGISLRSLYRKLDKFGLK